MLLPKQIMLNTLAESQPDPNQASFEASPYLSRNPPIYQIHIHTRSLDESKVLRLCVADNLAQVIACHCKSITIAVTELGATNLCVRHTLIVQMGNLRRNEEGTHLGSHKIIWYKLNMGETTINCASILDLLRK